MSAPNLFLIDGSGFLFRAFHALPPLTRPDGTPVNAVLGFTNMLTRLLEGAGDDRVAVIFDTARVSFRTEFFPAYKANRPPPPPELIPQFALIRAATRALNVPAIELENYEADDLIAAYAQAAVDAGEQVTIVSSDKDLMQLIRPGVTMLDPMKNKMIGPDEVIEKFGVPPEKTVFVQALMGDSVDNVPGVKGVGAKTAAKLIAEYGDLEAVLAAIPTMKPSKMRDNLAENIEAARISLRLVTLDATAPLPVPLADLDKKAPDPVVLRAFLEEQGFRTLLTKLGRWLEGAPSRAAPTPGPGPAPAAPSAEASYELIQDLPRLEAWVAEATRLGVVAVDTETSSLDARRADLVGVSLAVAPGRACYIPLGHVGAGTLEAHATPPQIPLDAALAALRPLLADPGVLKIGHNLKYDIQVLGQDRYGLAVAPYDDTMLLSYVLDGGAHGHGMDELAERHLGHQTIAYDTVTGTGKARISFAQVPLDQALAYAAEDADITLRLWQSLKPRLPASRVTRVYEYIERPLPVIVAAMEKAGVKLDQGHLARLSADFATRLAVLEAELHAMVGQPFNVQSPKQLGEILFDKMGLPGGKKTKTGAWSTDSDVLETLAEQGIPLAARILDHRQLAKLKSTYTDALAQQIDPATGRVHTSFSLAGTSTGRLSSTDPNLQNIPIRTEEGRKIREAFIAERGHVLLSVDYSQIELRLLAEIANIDALKTAFRDGIDIHAMTAAQVFGGDPKTIDKETRRKAKAINFGIIYGISAFGLARNIDVSPREASVFIDAYFTRFPGIKAYMEQAKETARRQGFVETLFGRRCHIQNINDKNQGRRGFAERQAINAPIQGAAADLVKKAMIRVGPALRAAGLGARMLLQVHDELLFEVPDAELDATAALVKSVMEGVASFSVPLIAEAGSGANWAVAH